MKLKVVHRATRFVSLTALLDMSGPAWCRGDSLQQTAVQQGFRELEQLCEPTARVQVHVRLDLSAVPLLPGPTLKLNLTLISYAGACAPGPGGGAAAA